MQLPTSAAQTPISRLERNWAMAAHLSAFAGLAGVPFGHVVGPLIIYLLRGHESEFVGEHARASLNFQITISILAIIVAVVGGAVVLGTVATAGGADAVSAAAQTAYGLSIATAWIAIGVAVLIVLLLSIIFIIVGTIRASEGLPYTYPFAIRFLR
ncbi:MAG: DUF4870 domain-containing protein [Candidatus Eremiobacteraeota bacterium]|nr:DUF4870 domain-containing protein [Candidatus Eremiobacteraeota bacterium]